VRNRAKEAKTTRDRNASRAKYFRTTPPASPDDVRSQLWNADITPATYSAEAEKYQAAVLDQYKIYVEMADRISARRALANTFFVTLNSTVLTTIGVFFGVLWKDKPNIPAAFSLPPLILLLALCLAWFWLVRSYRQLNSGKYAVIGALEEKLPASPYWRAEWTALGEGKDKGKYWPLTHLEQWVPAAFALIYIVGLLAVALS
jgi:hypothetical protein